MSKTLSKLCLVDRDEAAELPELSEELRLGLAEVAGAAREGLLAISVAMSQAGDRHALPTGSGATSCWPWPGVTAFGGSG